MNDKRSPIRLPDGPGQIYNDGRLRILKNGAGLVVDVCFNDREQFGVTIPAERLDG